MGSPITLGSGADLADDEDDDDDDDDAEAARDSDDEAEADDGAGTAAGTYSHFLSEGSKNERKMLSAPWLCAAKARATSLNTT